MAYARDVGGHGALDVPRRHVVGGSGGERQGEAPQGRGKALHLQAARVIERRQVELDLRLVAWLRDSPDGAVRRRGVSARHGPKREVTEWGATPHLVERGRSPSIVAQLHGPFGA